MVSMRLAFGLFFGLILGTSFLMGQNVAEDILKGKEIQGIVFRNYVGPHKIIETRQAIKGIGEDLGRQMKVSGATHAEYGQNYRVIRLHDPASDRLSADLIILGPGAGVDNIRNLNWIVSSYLQQVFGYSAADADLLSDFVTRYNAFYRGKMDYVKATYIPSVAENVTAENAGIALSYTNWPGKTRMMIPLRDSLSKGLGGSINTEEISNKDVVKDSAAQPGALEERKKLVALKEAEIVQEQKAVIQAETKTPPAPTAPGTTPPSPTKAPPAAAAAAAQSPATAPTPATTTTTATKPPAAPATLPLAQAKQQLAARDQALQAERQSIVQQETQKAATPAPTTAPAPVKPASTVGFVKMNSTKTGQLWLIDPVSNKVWKKSELNSVRETQAPTFGTGILVVAGDTKVDNGAIRLVLLSKDDGSLLSTGADDVSPDTPLIVNGSLVLALTKAKGGWVLGSFDTNLKSVAKGTDLLASGTDLVPTPSGILVQSDSGPVVLLDSATLKKISTTGE